MKFAVERSALARLTDIVCPAAMGGGTIPVLDCALLSASDGSLRLAATDMDLEVRDAADANITADGSLCVDAAHLRAFAKSARSGSQIEGEHTDGRLTLRAGRARAAFATIEAGDFPVMNFAADAREFSLPSAALSRLLDETSFAAATDQSKAWLMGVLLTAADRLSAVATNTHILAARSVPLPEGADGLPPIIIPTRAAQRIAELSRGVGRVTLAATDRLLRVAASGVTLTTKLIDGQFPDWPRFVPPRSRTPALVTKADLAAAIATASISVEADKERARPLLLEFKRDELLVSGSGSSGEASDSLSIGYEGAPERVLVNAAYLLAIIRHIDCDTIEFHPNGEMGPWLICAEGNTDDISIIVPRR